jgi:hypothetical protein
MTSCIHHTLVTTHYEGSKGMYNGREDMFSLSPPYHLEKASSMTCTMHYLLLSSLTINVK